MTEEHSGAPAQPDGVRQEDSGRAGPAAGPRRRVLLVDEAVRWVRHPRDLYQAAIALIAIILVMLLAIYGRSTTLAFTHDVQNATARILETVLLVPINFLEGLLSFVLPAMILIDLMWHRRWRTLATAIISALSAVAMAYALAWFFEKYFPISPLTEQLADSLEEQAFIRLLPYVAVISALLTVASTEKAWKATSWGWPLLTIALILSVLKGNQSLPGALITVFLGIFAGQLARYIAGDVPERATGANLVATVRRAGLDATQIVRIDELPNDVPLYAWDTTTTAPLGFVDRFGLEQIQQLFKKASSSFVGEKMPSRKNSSQAHHAADSAEPGDEDDVLEEFEGSDTTTFALNNAINASQLREELLATWHPPLGINASRNYLAVTADGKAYHIAFVDADRQIVGVLAAAWKKIVMTTTTRKVENTIEATADRMALMTYAAIQAGLAPAQDVRVASGEASMLLSYEVEGSYALSHYTADEIPDAALDQLWDTLQQAHLRGISHGNLTADTVALHDDKIRILHWENGSVAATEMARRIDMAQALALIASRVGVDRAVASAQRCLPLDQILSLAPILQKAILPARTLHDFADKKELQALRDALAATVPETSDVELAQMRRFSVKTVLTVSIGLVAVYLLLVSINLDELKETLSYARPLWMVGAFAIGLTTYLGAAMVLQAYTAERLNLWDTFLVQMAASLVGLVAPAGIGPAALNLRFLYKNRVKTPVAVATVSLVQVAQFITTLGLLLLVGLMTGDMGSFSIPSQTILIVLAVLVAFAAAVLFIRPLRVWIMKKVGPTLNQIWPRIVWLGTHPGRIAYGFLGSLIQTAGFVGAFGASLAAFGYHLPLITLVVTYLVSNTVGSMVPSPGGIGPVEAALTGGLTLARVPYSIAFSTALLYRLVTFWGRVPLGWIAMRACQRRDVI